MKIIPMALGAAIILTAATSATADGTSRKWRAPLYARAGISSNLITPYYVGYFPSHYSHYRPDPLPRGHTDHPRLYRDGFWCAYDGHVWWGC